MVKAVAACVSVCCPAAWGVGELAVGDAATSVAAFSGGVQLSGWQAGRGEVFPSASLVERREGDGFEWTTGHECVEEACESDGEEVFGSVVQTRLLGAVGQGCGG